MINNIDIKEIKIGSKQLEGSVDSSKKGFLRAPQNRKEWLIVAAVVVVIGAIGLFIWNSNASNKNASTKDRQVPVNVATAQLSSVPIEIRTIGNVAPFSVVNITPQVSGQLSKVYFTQGDYVHQGDLLFQIDPRPYQAALDQAEGNVARDKAQVLAADANLDRDQANVGQMQANLQKDIASAKFAKTEKGRYQLLFSQGAVSNEQSDQYMTNSATADATIEADKKTIENAKAVVMADRAAIKTAQGTLSADQGAADNAKIQLGWTQIRSPIDGKTGSLNVYQGNIVTANSTNPIVTVNQIKPIYVTMTVPEQYLDDVRRTLKDGTLKIQALVEGVRTDSVDGTVSFIENTVNMNTGTVLMRASFANDGARLFPGQFVDVVLNMPPGAPSPVVPTVAVQTTQQGHSVYIVKDGKAILTPVEIKQTYRDSIAIGKGISAGDVVVTDGQLQLSPGAKVQVVKQ